MSGFFLSLLAVMLASTGGRDWPLVSQLSRSLGKPPPLLAIVWLSSAATATLAGVAGAWMASIMPLGGKAMLLAIALALAAAELIWRSTRRPSPQEPTRSAAAILIVLFAHQLGDAGRFLVFALAIASAEPPLVIAGGALGGGVALTLAWWLAAEPEVDGRLKKVRLATATVFLLVAMVIAILTLGLI